MSIQGIREAIQTGLSTISGLRAYSNVPESISDLPCAFPIPKTGSYDFTAGGTNYVLSLEVILLLGRQGDLEESQSNIDVYIAPTGSSSIKAAIEAVDFGVHGDVVRVSAFRDYGGMSFGGTLYLGCRFDVSVWV